MTPIGEHMSAPVVTVAHDQSLAEASEIMAERRVHHLLVTDRARPVGVLSQRDLLLLESRKQVHPEVLPVGEAMNPDVYIVTPGAPLDDVVRELAARGADCAIIADETGPRGIFTTVDALRVLARLLAR
jgi:acetoin utilization protein AcuB